MSGALAGRLGLLRGVLSTQVRFLAPWSASACRRLAGAPTALKPPKAITAPSGMSRTASAQEAKILLAMVLPAAFLNVREPKRSSLASWPGHARLGTTG